MVTKRSPRALPLADAIKQRVRLAAAQADLAESRAKKERGDPIEAEWARVLRTVRADILAVPTRCATRLPHLSAHDVSEIDREVREALIEISNGEPP
jgi:phage terminase Nu1 subunit (DNA packaging protein)